MIFSAFYMIAHRATMDHAVFSLSVPEDADCTRDGV